MTTFATVAAIILGPILAVQVQKLIERATQKRSEKKKIFVTLLATRDRTLDPGHVEALNTIHLFFSGKRSKDRAVVEAWDLYLDHLANGVGPPKPDAKGKFADGDLKDYDERLRKWGDEGIDLRCDLPKKMAESLGYHFPDLWLKKGAYTPQAYGNMELNQQTILRGLAEVFLGNRSLPMSVVEFPTEKKSQKAMMDFLQGKQTIPVRMEGSEQPVD